jgi:hypothetical protein
MPDNLFPKLTAIHLGLKLSAHQECPTQLPIQTVRLLRWRSESMSEHDRDQGSDRRGDGLLGEFVFPFMAERA